MPTLYPIGTNIVVQPCELPNTTPSGLYLTPTNERSKNLYEVTAVGPDVGMLLGICAGTKVILGQFDGEKVEFGGETYRIIDVSKVLAIID